MQNVVADANRRVEPLRKVNEAYKQSSADEIYGDPIYRVIRFFNLADQGFHRLFGEIKSVCAVTEEDCS